MNLRQSAGAIALAVLGSHCAPAEMPPAVGPAPTGFVRQESPGMLCAANAASPADLNEEIVRIPFGEDPDHAALSLDATVFRPDGTGPFPLIILNHGSIGKPDKRPRWRPFDVASWFVHRGFVVVVPMRRGNATSGGDWSDSFGTCRDPNYLQSGLEAAKDIRAAVEFMKRRPYVDRNRIVIHGFSAGGFAALAFASTHPDGAIGVLNFAGVRGSQTNDKGLTRTRCSDSELVRTTTEFGRTTQIPTMWLYSQNDKYGPPEIARSMFDSFRAAGGNGEFVALPPFNDEGHYVSLARPGIALWEKPVDHFLVQLGLCAPPR